jgi:hypothetical protein
MTPRVLVFGSGPAGLLAAHTASLMGAQVRIYSEGHYSKLFGAQYLHILPTGLKVPETKILYNLRGSVQDYRKKVYGQSADKALEVSPTTFGGTARAFDIRTAYDQLWAMYSRLIISVTVQDGYDFEGLVKGAGADVVVNTIPAQVICKGQHAFTSQLIYAIGDAPELGVQCPIRMPRDTVMCNAKREPAWYRASTIFGYSTAEWPAQSQPPIPDVARVLKPLSTNCDCFPYLIRGGRYGQWKKGVLSHHVIPQVQRALFEEGWQAAYGGKK